MMMIFKIAVDVNSNDEIEGNYDDYCNMRQ